MSAHQRNVRGAIVKKRLFLFLTTAVAGFCFATASAFAQQWTLTLAPSNAWTCVAASADLSKIVAAASPGGIYYSHDSGTNWTESDAPTNNWAALASSTNGELITAVINGGGIWVSTNSGISWSETIAPSNQWAGVACSADGIRIVATGYESVWISTNFGTNWTLTSLPPTDDVGDITYAGVASSSNGMEVAVLKILPFGLICLSSDGGSNWISIAADYPWNSIVCSADGTTLAGVSYGVSITTNGGADWQETLYYGEYGTIAGSGDCSKLVLITGSSPLYVSADTGATWTTTPSPGASLTALALSSDGNRFVAVVNGGGIYLWQATFPLITSGPQTQTVPASTTVELSVEVFAPALPLTYQWFFNNAPLQGQTGSTLILASVTLGESGSYSVAVSNSFGSSLSSTALVTILPSLLSTQSPDPSLYDSDLLASVSAGSENTSFYFEWGLTTNYGRHTVPLVLQGPNTWSISNLISGLTPYTTYHYQAVASNEFGTVLGGDVSFTTVPKFVQVGTNTDWNACVLSSDGRELVASMNGTVYISTNLGATFTATAGLGSVFAVSSNGATILSFSDTNIYVSLDRGLTWITNSAPTTFAHVTASSDAQKIAAIDGSPTVYTSTNFGGTWNQSTFSPPFSGAFYGGLASSIDGSQIYGSATSYPGGEFYLGWIFGSKDSGSTWEIMYGLSDRVLNSVACSANGSIVFAGGWSFGALSTNGGSSWSNYYSEPFIFSVACSEDAKVIILITTEYPVIQASPNTGGTWYSANYPGSGFENQVMSIMCSADGKTLAVFGNGAIYVSLPPPSEPSALSVATSTSNGLPSFQFTGQPGYTYVVQASTNLANWTNIATIVNSNGTVPFTDPDSTNYEQRYYRTVVP
jgi:hypothetical protein